MPLLWDSKIPDIEAALFGYSSPCAVAVSRSMPAMQRAFSCRHVPGTPHVAIPEGTRRRRSSSSQGEVQKQGSTRNFCLNPRLIEACSKTRNPTIFPISQFNEPGLQLSARARYVASDSSLRFRLQLRRLQHLSRRRFPQYPMQGVTVFHAIDLPYRLAFR